MAKRKGLGEPGRLMNQRRPLRPDMTLRQISADYPACQEVLRRHREPDRPGIKFGRLEPLKRFAQRNGIECDRLLHELAAAAGVGVAPDSANSRNVHRPFIVTALATTLSIGAGWGAWLLWQIGRAQSFDAAAAGSVAVLGEAQLWGFIVPLVNGIALRYLPAATSQPAVSMGLARGMDVTGLCDRERVYLGTFSHGGQTAQCLRIANSTASNKSRRCR